MIASFFYLSADYSNLISTVYTHNIVTNYIHVYSAVWKTNNELRANRLIIMKYQYYIERFIILLLIVLTIFVHGE